MDGIVGFEPHPVVWLLAIAAALLGVLGCVFGAASRWRYRALQQRVSAIEEARRSERARRAKQARLHAFVEQQVEVTYFLTIQNHGPAQARNLTASINGAPLHNCPLIDPKACDLAGLGAVMPHHGLRIPLHTADRPPELELELTWSDESGQLGFYQASLPDDRCLDATSRPRPPALDRPSDHES